MGKLIKVTLLHSGINQKQDQKDTLLGLGLTKQRKTVCLKNNSATRGMIRKVTHLVAVKLVDEDKCKAAPAALPSYRVVSEQ